MVEGIRPEGVYRPEKPYEVKPKKERPDDDRFRKKLHDLSDDADDESQSDENRRDPAADKREEIEKLQKEKDKKARLEGLGDNLDVRI